MEYLISLCDFLYLLVKVSINMLLSLKNVFTKFLVTFAVLGAQFQVLHTHTHSRRYCPLMVRYKHSSPALALKNGNNCAVLVEKHFKNVWHLNIVALYQFRKRVYECLFIFARNSSLKFVCYIIIFVISIAYNPT